MKNVSKIVKNTVTKDTSRSDIKYIKKLHKLHINLTRENEN